MNIIGIDPGPTVSTFVHVEFSARSLLDPGITICGVGEMDNHDMLERLRQTFGSIIVCEMIACYGMAVGKEVFETCRWIGRFEQRVADVGLKLETLTRVQCKMQLCQSMRAKDANIRQALMDRFGEVGRRSAPGPLYGISGHAWSAVAVATTWRDLALEAENESARVKTIVTDKLTVFRAASCESAAGGKL
jgi:hypothetical protein